jgi:hypothetical protein
LALQSSDTPVSVLGIVVPIFAVACWCLTILRGSPLAVSGCRNAWTFGTGALFWTGDPKAAVRNELSFPKTFIAFESLSECND